MSSAKDKVIAVFVEESTEIIEQLENELMLLDDSPWDKSIINEVFRGVHTLKGNANSFGFVKLGQFVHYFEDLLDFYREPNHTLTKGLMQLIFDAYDIIKEVFENEKNQVDSLPQGYSDILFKIKEALEQRIEIQCQKEQLPYSENLIVKNHFFHEKYNHSELETFNALQKQKIYEQCIENKKVYNIVMEFDTDIYTRGYNHTIFFKLFSNLGQIVHSIWYFNKNIPSLENFTTELSYISRISLYLISDEPLEQIEDVFEFIAEDEEVGISILDCKVFNNQKSSEEIEQVKSIQEDSINEEQQSIKGGTKKTVSQSIRIESSKIDELFDSIGELVIAQSFIDQNEVIKALDNLEINQYISMLGKTTRSIQNKVMKLRMIPIRDTFFKMKRVVRDVSQKTNKQVELILKGEETEIDKTMVDNLGEPLIHLIRNSIDHGLESSTKQRLIANKSEIGKVSLSAMHKGSNFIIEIQDDGRGIDTQKILQKAIDKNLASSDKNYTEDEILQFLFMAGFSTAESITDVSGRGVGLDAVKQSIEALKGKIQVETKLGEGSIFRIVLPLTLAIIDGMSVKVSDEIFILPTLSVVESFKALKKDIQKAQSKGEFINFRGDILPVVHLGKLLEIPEALMDVEKSTLICVEHEKGRFVLQVDSLLGRQQVVIKSLGKKLGCVKEISGAAIMGSGDIALILNPEGIRDWLDIAYSPKGYL